MKDEKKCEHKLKYNEEEDFVFCQKCGKRWSNETIIQYETTHNPVTYTSIIY